MNRYEVQELFGLNLRKTLIERRSTQKQLANAMGRSQMQVNRWCLGRSMPGWDTLCEMIGVLDIAIDDLFRARVSIDPAKGDDTQTLYKRFHDFHRESLRKEALADAQKRQMANAG